MVDKPRKIGDVAIMDILRVVCDVYSVKPSQVRGKSQAWEHTRPRHIIWYVAVEEFGRTLSECGRLFDRDHSTVHRAIEVLRGKVASDDVLLSRIERITARVIDITNRRVMNATDVLASIAGVRVP